MGHHDGLRGSQGRARPHEAIQLRCHLSGLGRIKLSRDGWFAYAHGVNFEKEVENALQLIPAELRRHIDNVQIVIEDEPSDELLNELGIPEGETLFGLYSGTPLTERTTEYAALPDCITIFRQPLLDEFPDPVELRTEIARTVIHEIAHHFGIDEDRLADLGWD
jgi:predicted Zn-dependent protease with MMP-like domain